MGIKNAFTITFVSRVCVHVCVFICCRYGYVEFQSSKDLKEAYNDADGRKIAGVYFLFYK